MIGTMEADHQLAMAKERMTLAEIRSQIQEKEEKVKELR